MSRRSAPESAYSFRPTTRSTFALRIVCAKSALTATSRTTSNPSAEHSSLTTRVLGEHSMSAITVNAFPPLHAFNSSRAWFLALIVLLHAGFFWVLTHGVTIGSLSVQPQFILIDPAPDKPQPPPKPRPLDIDPVVKRVYVPQIEIPRFEPIEAT